MGYGDALMATGEVKLLRKKPDTKFVIGDGTRSYWSSIFDNNPYIIRGRDVKNFKNVIWVKNYEFNRPYRRYSKNLDPNNYNWNHDHKASPGELFFTSKEENFSERIQKTIINKYGKKKIIFVEPHVKNRKGFENKDWGFHKWQEVINRLNNKYLFIQTSYDKRKSLKNVINIHGINFRYACALMKITDLFIGTEGGMHHAAAALNKKAVVIFGGHISPDITGYSFHKNLYIADEFSPCGNKLKCKHCEECLNKIKKEQFIKEIENQL